MYLGLVDDFMIMTMIEDKLKLLWHNILNPCCDSPQS